MISGRLSIILPARNEQFLVPTVVDILKQATGDVEVIAVLDGWWPKPFFPDDKRLQILHFGSPKGMRPGINAGVQMSTGEFIMKLDGHCAVAKGFDEVLKSSCEETDIVIPEKYSLDPEKWERKPKEPWHYFYLSWPWDPTLQCVSLQDRNYGRQYNDLRRHIPVDDIMAYQGSAWVVRRKHFDRLRPNGLDDEHYYFCQEPVEMGIRNWLSGGRVRIDKRTWYAHLWKGNAYPRQFPKEKGRWELAMEWSARHWMLNQEPGMIHPFSWVVEKFWPLPGWPDNWQEEVAKRFA